MEARAFDPECPESPTHRSELRVPSLGLVLDPDTPELRIHGTLIDCPPRALRLLASLLENAGSVVTKDEILARAWDGIHVGETSLHEAVSLLRRTLAGVDPTRSALATVRGRGYRWRAPVVHAGSDRPWIVSVPVLDAHEREIEFMRE